jgi:esterase/lipase superfamily enzyme
MMPTPLAVLEAGDRPFAGVDPEERTPTLRVLYATDRAPDQPRKRGARYGSVRSDVVRLGEATVRLGPAGWDWDRLAAETASGSRPPVKVTDVQEFGVLGAMRGPEAPRGASLSAEGLPSDAGLHFASLVDHRLDSCASREVYVYVPGFNVTFELALRRMAEFSHYLGRDGVFVAYAWPAHSHPFAYDMDRRSAMQSAGRFRDFVQYLAENTGAEKIHLIASSAGAPVVSGALVAMREECGATMTPAQMRERTRLGHVVYAASDQDVDGFRAMLLSGADELAEHITVYSSSEDLGLVLTRHFGSGDKTIGRLPAHLTEADAALLRERAAHVTVVDATGALDDAGRGGMWSHSYWYLNSWVSSDLLGLLRHGISAERRGLVATRDGAMWGFPEDYPERLREHLMACRLMETEHAGR